MKKTQLSIIIPHYNNSDGLRRLLASIPSDPNIEVIVIDDHSNNQIELINSWKQEYSNRNISYLYYRNLIHDL